MGLTSGFQMHCYQLIFNVFDKAESDIFNRVKSRCRGRVPSRVTGGARAGLRGTPLFCCKNKEGGTKGAPLGWSTD